MFLGRSVMIRKWLVLFLLVGATSALAACDDETNPTPDAGGDVPKFDVPVPDASDDDAGDPN